MAGDLVCPLTIIKSPTGPWLILDSANMLVGCNLFHFKQGERQDDCVWWQKKLNNLTVPKLSPPFLQKRSPTDSIDWAEDSIAWVNSSSDWVEGSIAWVKDSSDWAKDSSC